MGQVRITSASFLQGLLELHFTTEERIVMPIMKRLVQRDSHGMWPKSIVASMQLSHGQLACFMLSTLSRQDRAKYSAAMEVRGADRCCAAFVD